MKHKYQFYFFIRLARTTNSIENATHATIEPTIGHADLAGIIDNNVPTNAPIEKRIVPAKDETVPAICG